MVGATRFELVTICTPSKRATSLRYAPTGFQQAAKGVPRFPLRVNASSPIFSWAVGIPGTWIPGNLDIQAPGPPQPESAGNLPVGFEEGTAEDEADVVQEEGGCKRGGSPPPAPYRKESVQSCS